MFRNRIIFNNVDYLLLLLCWILLFSIYTITIYSFPIVSVAIVLAILRMNKTTLGLSLILFIPHILGVLFAILNLSVRPFYVCIILASLLLGHSFFIQKGSSKSLFYFIILIVLFTIWYLWGPRHSYSSMKLIYIVFLGLFGLLSMKYYIERNDVQITKIVILLCLISISYICLGISFFQISKPHGLLDISFIRDSFYLIMREDTIPFSYHAIGNTALMGLALLLCKQQDEFNAFLKYSILLFLIIIVIISQARQALLGTFILFYFRIFIRNRNVAKRLLMIGLITLFIYWGISNLSNFSEVFSSTIQATTTENAINRDYEKAFTMIKQSPILGSGLGGYSLTGKRDYPHNLLLELLCEMGVLGTFLVIVVTFLPIIPRIKRIFSPTRSGIIPFIFILPYFVRSMSSSDLTESILFLTMLITISQTKDKFFTKHN